MIKCLIFVIQFVFIIYDVTGKFFFNNDEVTMVIYSPDLKGTLDNENMNLIDRRLPVKFLVPGYSQSTNLSIYTPIVNNYIKRGNVSLITVDYPRIANMPFPESFFNIHIVELYVAQFIRQLNFIGIPTTSIHLIGHSMGGQMVGRMGNIYHSITGGQKIGRITGLDPAKIGFESVLVMPSDKITPDSADIVDVLHTDTLTVAVLQPSGTVDFYANRGLAPQPGCPHKRPQPLIDGIPLTDGWTVPLSSDDVCSHSRSLALFAQSILQSDNLIGRRCYQWDVINKVCNESGDKDEDVVYGEDMPTTASGIFYFNTTSSPPYTSRVEFP